MSYSQADRVVPVTFGLPRGQLAKIVFPISSSIITFVGFSIAVYIYDLNLNTRYLPIDGVICAVVGTLFICSYLRAAFTSPGLVKKGWTKKYHNTEDIEEIAGLLTHEDEAVDRPPRSHYCYELQSNVLRMDHFCIWFNNAVGLYNYKYFVLTMFYLSLICIIIIITLIYRVFISPFEAYRSGGNRFFRTICLLLSFMFCACFAIFGSMHTLMHIWQAAKNLTSIEYRPFMRTKSEAFHFDLEFVDTHQFDHGTFLNLQNMFGKNICFWLLPIAPCLIEDGYEFKINLQNKAKMENMINLIQSKREQLWKIPKLHSHTRQVEV